MSIPSPFDPPSHSTGSANSASPQYSPSPATPTYGPYGNDSAGPGFQGSMPKAVNYWGLIALGLIAIRDIIGLSTAAFSNPFDVEMREFIYLFSDVSFLVLSALALPLGIMGVMRKNTRAWWTALLATGMGAWSLIVRLISFLLLTSLTAVSG